MLCLVEHENRFITSGPGHSILFEVPKETIQINFLKPWILVITCVLDFNDYEVILTAKRKFLVFYHHEINLTANVSFTFVIS